MINLPTCYLNSSGEKERERERCIYIYIYIDTYIDIHRDICVHTEWL